MDTITQEDIRPQREGELTSPLPPKRPRTDCTRDHSGKSTFDFPDLLTFWKTTGSSSSASTYVEDENPHERPEDAQFIVIPVTSLTSHAEDAHAGSPEVCSIAAERCFKRLLRDERPPVAATDELSSYLLDDDDDDDDRALAETRTSKDASADTSSHPDCKPLGKALEDEPPGGRGLHAGNNEAGRLINSTCQIRAFTVSSSDEGVRCQADCTHEDALRDTGFCNMWSQSAGAGESNQEWEEHGFREDILFSEEMEEGNSLISFTHADSDSFYSDLQPSGKLAHGVKTEDKILELQMCENENVAVCNGETKDQVNENDMSINSIPPAALCAEGSVVSYDVVSAINITIESVSLEADDFCGAKGEEAAGEMIAKARSETPDHTTETPIPARISQGPAEGDNDASPFSVIDPAIWSETDREAKEKRCNSASAAAGVTLFSSVKVCEMETLLPLRPDIRLSQEVSAPDQKSNHQSRTQQCKDDEEEDSWQSHTEPQACSINTKEAHNKAGSDSSCHWESSPSSRPAELPPAGDGRQGSHDTVGHPSKEPHQSGCFPVSPDQLETKEVQYLQAEFDRMDGATEMNEREGMRSFEEEIRAGEHGKQPENSPEEKHAEISAGDSTSDRTEGQTSKHDDTSTHADDALKNNLSLLSDHAYNAVLFTTGGTAEEKESKEEASVGEESDVHGYSELLVESEVDHQQQRQQDEDTPEECISECTKGSTSQSGHALTLVSEREQENKLSRFSGFRHRAETFMVDNEDDPLEFTAFPFNGRMPGGFDTFERIQLSLDGDEDSLSNSPLLTSLPEQLLISPQQQLRCSTPEAESNEHEEVPEEEVEEEEEENTENMAKGFPSSDTRCNEVPRCISAAADDVALGRPEQRPDCESASPSSECFFQEDLNTRSASSAGPSNDSPKFEKRKLFDMVLKELNLFFDISTSDFSRDGGASSPEQCVDVAEALEGDTLNHKEHLSSPKLGCYRDASPDDADEDPGLDMSGGDPAAPCSSGGGGGEQEVPLGSHQEPSVCTAERHKVPGDGAGKENMVSVLRASAALGTTELPTAGANQATGASEDLRTADPDRTVEESHDQTPAPAPPLQVNLGDAIKVTCMSEALKSRVQQPKRYFLIPSRLLMVSLPLDPFWLFAGSSGSCTFLYSCFFIQGRLNPHVCIFSREAPVRSQPPAEQPSCSCWGVSALPKDALKAFVHKRKPAFCPHFPRWKYLPQFVCTDQSIYIYLFIYMRHSNPD